MREDVEGGFAAVGACAGGAYAAKGEGLNGGVEVAAGGRC